MHVPVEPVVKPNEVKLVNQAYPTFTPMEVVDAFHDIGELEKDDLISTVQNKKS